MGRLVHILRLARKAKDTFRNQGVYAVWRKIRFYLERRRGIRSLEIVLMDYDRWVKENRITCKERARIHDELKTIEYKPKISIVMPVYNVAQVWLQRAIESVSAQYYDNWELCIADDASNETHIHPILEKYAAEDRRIKLAFLEKWLWLYLWALSRAKCYLSF